MLRVIVELVPHGNEAQKRTLVVMNIANQGSGDDAEARYDVREMWHDGRVLFRTTPIVKRDPNVLTFLRNLFSATH